jgi:hypothetical protein
MDIQKLFTLVTPRGMEAIEDGLEGCCIGETMLDAHLDAHLRNKIANCNLFTGSNVQQASKLYALLIAGNFDKKTRAELLACVEQQLDEEQIEALRQFGDRLVFFVANYPNLIQSSLDEKKDEIPSEVEESFKMIQEAFAGDLWKWLVATLGEPSEDAWGWGDALSSSTFTADELADGGLMLLEHISEMKEFQVYKSGFERV